MNWIDDLLEDKPEESQIYYCLGLIETSIYEERKKCKLERNVFTYTSDELEKLIIQLNNDQLDNIEAGQNYQQGDIARKLNKQGL